MVMFCAAVSVIDHRRKRLPAPDLSVSFLVPCYNDGETIRATIESIFEVCRASAFEVLVANDASTDGSGDLLDELAERFPLRVVHHAANLGKAETLNRLARHARHDILVFVDADTILNPRALRDMMERFGANSRLGAVSCPYQPLNKGWLPSLQSVDYSMIMLLQGGYNATSGLALWGGCLAVRADAFERVGGFSLSAITEDVDLAHKLNRVGWKVQQSLVPVRTVVPGTLRGWIRQKARWTAGGFQCLYVHPSVWLRNPLHVILMAIYTFLSLSCVLGLAHNTLVLGRMIELMTVIADVLPWHDVVPVMSHLYSPLLMKNLWLSLAFGLLNGIYVIPLISQWQDVGKFLWVFPFMLAYFPIYVVVSLIGLGYFLLHSRRLTMQEARAW